MQNEVKNKLNNLTFLINSINEEIGSLNEQQAKLESEIKANSERAKKESYLPNVLGGTFFGWLSVVSPSLFLKCFFLGWNINNFCRFISKIKRNREVEKNEESKTIALLAKKVQLSQIIEKREDISQKRFLLMDEFQKSKLQNEI